MSCVILEAVEFRKLHLVRSKKIASIDIYNINEQWYTKQSHNMLKQHVHSPDDVAMVLMGAGGVCLFVA